MHFLRLLRIFIPLLIIAAIVAGVVVVLSSRSELQSARRQVEEAWSPLRDALDTRYDVLAVAEAAVRETPALRQLVAQIERANADWDDLQRDASIATQVATANKLEALGRRLVQAARKAPRLQGKPSLAAVNVYASLAPPRRVAVPFEDAVTHYERERNRPARRLAATILGYKAVPAYDTSGSA